MANKKKKTFVESQPEGSLKGTFFDYIPDAMQMSNYLKQFMSKKDSEPQSGTGKAVIKGRGTKFKGVR